MCAVAVYVNVETHVKILSAMGFFYALVTVKDKCSDSERTELLYSLRRCYDSTVRSFTASVYVQIHVIIAP